MKAVVGKAGNVLSEKGRNGFNYAMLHYSKKENLPKILKVIENTSI